MLIFRITTRVRLLEGHMVLLLESSYSQGWMFPHEIGSRTTQNVHSHSRTLTTRYELVALNSLHRRINNREIKLGLFQSERQRQFTIKRFSINTQTVYNWFLSLLSLFCLSLFSTPNLLFILLLYTVLIFKIFAYIYLISIEC